MRKLNEQQQKAVDSNADRIICLAGAGAGKSTVLLARISRLVNEGVAPNSILALTFTNAAAVEMATRYKRDHASGKSPEFRTFHSFCYYLIITDSQIRSAVGYTNIPAVCEEAQLKRIKKEVRLQLGLTISEEKLFGQSKMPLTRKEQDELELFNKRLKKQLKVENLITFDIMCYDISQLFVDNHPATQRYKEKYTHIFVDEFQDTDMRQVKFLSSFKESNFFIVGDALQSIYGWRGTTNEPLKQFAKSSAWECIKLFENYRSSEEICNFANRMSKYADEEYRIEMHGQFSGPKVNVEYGSMSTFHDAVDTVHTSMVIQKLHEVSGTSAVLCRSNREVKYLCDAFKAEGIEYKQNKPDDKSIEIIECVHNNDYMLDWLSALLPAEKYAEFIKLSTQVENPDIFWFAKTYNTIPEVSEYGKKIVAIRKILKMEDHMFTKIQAILKVLNRDDILKELSVEMINSEDPILEQVKSLLLLNKEVSCYVGTIHSVKGLEYDNVFVMGVNDRSFPLDTEEMKNLYYVAITRAKTNLFIYRV